MNTNYDVTDIALTRGSGIDTPGYQMVGAIGGCAYLWVQRAEGEPITEIRIQYNELDSVPEGYFKIGADVNMHGNKRVYICGRKAGKGQSPIVSIKLTTSDDHFILGGYTKLPQCLNPGQADKRTPRQYLMIKTRASAQRQDERRWEVGEKIDAQDTSSSWLVAKILKIREDGGAFYITYVGWPPKWDEWIDKASPRLAPLGHRTLGRWTGREGRPPFNLDDNLEKFQETAKKIKELEAAFKSGQTPSEEEIKYLTQGENRDFLENVLGAEIEDADTVAPLVQEYLQTNIRLILYAMNNPKLFPTRILHGLIPIFGGGAVDHRFYTSVATTVKEKSGAKYAKKNTDTPISTFLIDNINFFGDEGGFDLIAKRLTANLEGKGDTDSFETISIFIKVLATIKEKQLFNTAFSKKYLKELKLQDLAYKTLAKITDDELKNLDKEAFNMLLMDVKILLKSGKEKDIDQFAEKFQLEIALRLLSANVLRKRLDALSQLKETIRSVNFASNPSLVKEENGEGEQRDDRRSGGMNLFRRVVAPPQDPQIVKAKYLTPDKLVAWLNENKIVSKVLGKGAHEQLVKMSPTILKFLAQNNAFKDEHIELLWNTAAGGDEGLRRIVYEALADLAQELSDKFLDGIYSRISSLPLKDYRDFNLLFLRDFTVNAVKAAPSAGKWYGLDIFWQLVQDENSSKVSKDVKLLAMQCFKDILSQKLFESQRGQYLEKCMLGLKEGKSVVQCLNVAIQIIALSEADAPKLIEKVEKKFKLLDTLLDDFQRYVDSAKKVPCDPSEFKEGKESPTLIGGTPHAVHLSQRLMFLGYVVSTSNSKLTLEKKHVQLLWKVFVESPVAPSDANILLRWLQDIVTASYRQQEGKKKTETLPLDMIKHVFDSLLCVSAPPTRQGFECFQTYFLELNLKAKAINSPSPLWLVVQDFKALTGVDALWQYAINAPDPQVALAARNFLTTLYIRLDLNLNSKDKRAVYQKYLEKAMERLTLGYQALQKEGKDVSPKTIRSAVESVELLNLFLYRIESGEANKRPLFAAGERVTAWWKTQRAKKYGAVIEDVNPDLTYKVKYDDGDYDPKAPETNIFQVDEQKKKPVKSSADEEDEKFPKMFLSSEKKYFELYFNLLDFGGELADKVWQLFKRLPTNPDMEEKVKALAKQETIDWKLVFPTDSTIKLLYTLQIVRDSVLILERPPVPPPDELKAWNLMFLEKGGFAHIYNFLISTEQEVLLRDVLPQQCTALVIALLRHFIVSGTDVLGVESKVVQEAVDPSKLANALFKIISASVSLKKIDEESAKLQADLVQKAFLLLAHVVAMKPELSQGILEWAWEPVLVKGLTENTNRLFRNELSLGIQHLCAKISSVHTKNPRAIFLPILLSKLETINTSSSESACSEYFATLEFFIKDSAEGDFDAKLVSQQITKLLKSHPIQEATEKDTDDVLVKLLSLASQLVIKVPGLRALLGAASGEGNLIKSIVDMLFQLPEMDNSFGATAADNPPPKCKSPLSRKAGFHLLAEMCKDEPSNAALVAKLLIPNHYVTHSNGKKAKVWDFVPGERQTRSKSAGYVGLKNLGCICYLNAAMQQLFMIPSLRQNILAIDEYKEADLSKDIVYQLQYIMAHLQESEKQYINPKPLTDIWMDESGKKPINVSKQEDSSAFVIRLIDRVTEALKGGKHANAFRDVLGGLFEHQLIGLGDCPHSKVSRDEEFFTIPLEVKNKKNIEESLKAFVAGSEVEGYNCDECKKKVTVVKRAVIKKLPPTLCLTLKRFVLNFTTFQTEKLDDRIEFPMELDVRPYTVVELPLPKPKPTEGKEGEDEGKDGKDAKAETPAKPKEDETPAAPKKDEESYKYVLRGVVIHTGTAHSGHYYSFIQERLVTSDGKTTAGDWYKFNDTSVTPFNPQEIADQCYGGSNPRAYAGFGGTANGYLLFYDRVDKEEAPTDDEKDGDTAAKKTKVVARRARPKVPTRIFQDIWTQNITYWRDKAVFDEQYFEFLWRFQSDFKDIKATDAKEVSEVDLSTPHNTRDALTRLFTRFFFLTLARSKEKGSIGNWTNALRHLYTNNLASSVWLLNFVSNISMWIPNEFLLDCPDDATREGTADIISIAIQNTAPLELKSFESDILVRDVREAKGEAKEEGKGEAEGKTPAATIAPGDEKQDPRGYVVGFIDWIVRFLNNTPYYWRNFKGFYKVLATFAGVGTPQAHYAEKHYLIAKLIDIYLKDKSPYPETNNIQPDRNGKRPPMRANSQNGGPSYPDFSTFFQLLRSLVVSKPLNDHSDWAKRFLLHHDFLASFLMEAMTHKKAQDVVAIFCHLANENKEVTQLIVEIIRRGLAFHNWEQIRPYFRTLLGLLEHQDSLQEWRVDLEMTNLYDAIVEHAKCWKEADMMIDHFIRFAKKNSLTLKWATSHQEALTWIGTWLNENQKPPQAKGDMKNGKERGEGIILYQDKWETYCQSHSNFTHGLTNAQKITAIEILKGGDEAKLDRKDVVYDSEEGYEMRVFEKDEKIDALDTDLQWLPALILDTHPQKGVFIKYEGWSEKWNEWLPVSSPRIAKANTMIIHNLPKKKKNT